jgi:hypothetical protein
MDMIKRYGVLLFLACLGCVIYDLRNPSEDQLFGKNATHRAWVGLIISGVALIVILFS